MNDNLSNQHPHNGYDIGQSQESRFIIETNTDEIGNVNICYHHQSIIVTLWIY